MPKTVAAFTLPIPLDSMETINACIERVYGTGNTLMHMDGDQFQIAAPRDGWGPRKRGRGALPSASNDQLRLKYIKLRDGKASLTVEDTQYAVEYTFIPIPEREPGVMSIVVSTTVDGYGRRVSGVESIVPAPAVRRPTFSMSFQVDPEGRSLLERLIFGGGEDDPVVQGR